ncbi:MAG: peptidylprolyl isomerase, partial [Nitrospinaceae bacterium]|nr:peptidylprolyl isomerase [Nitrospinaceae bacterium]NIR54856.1 peptidylprolyl isomerase [Nitrospinaceae bacterium]NIS85281.1 peptidylprolyl isomerase [Nitrospinaceae bacterium]NIT82094.1 peptidylprolyl isomerase [Nitrospinaceae bacterium]NIU44355.1 peptidylprolyl isomerase [Nitrospinaceae bacterium]
MTSKVIRFEMGNRIKVSDREMFHYYKNHQKEFWTPGKFFVSHILFIVDPKSADKERRLKELKAREILRRLRAGQDFAELARK